MKDELNSREELPQEFGCYGQQAEQNLNEIRLYSLLKLSQMHEKTLQEVMDFGLEEAIGLTDSKISVSSVETRWMLQGLLYVPGSSMVIPISRFPKSRRR